MFQSFQRSSPFLWTSSDRCQAPLKSRSDFAPWPDWKTVEQTASEWMTRKSGSVWPLLVRFNESSESSIRCPRTVCLGIVLRPNPTILAWTNVCHSDDAGDRADDKGGQRCMAETNCWNSLAGRKTSRECSRLRFKWNPSQPSRSNSKVTLALFNAQCHFLKARSTGCQLEGSKREYEGSRHFG